MRDEDLAAMFDCPENEIRETLAQASNILLEARLKRPPPHRDDKVVTAWNGLAIGALARGGRLLERGDLIETASEAAGFLKRELWDGERLFRSHRGHRGDAEAFPADYAFLVSGLIELHAAVPDRGWIEWALELQQKLDADFWDAIRSGYVMRPALGGETLLVIREDYDGAEPSPNHLAAENLLKLSTLLDTPAHAVRAEALLRAGSRMIETQSFAAPLLLAALDLHDRGVMKFQVPADADPAIRKHLRTGFLPRAVFAPGAGNETILCEGETCRPVSATDLEGLGTRFHGDP
jgi:uncharacterized protein YyaL (SSP411 family)